MCSGGLPLSVLRRGHQHQRRGRSRQRGESARWGEDRAVVGESCDRGGKLGATVNGGRHRPTATGSYSHLDGGEVRRFGENLVKITK
ncbi:hypothetical protein L484_021794 [Morus notabilis]|uniref:Uncharacterized protein n=1 Tax=Morus notabilis TaxID=981085 RepID=W9QSM9_9ROSA|nr:hypothetical protein L484_021794 [Morus notabilis]